jgi:glutathione synthase
MAQRFIPEITDGDRRVLLVDGEPVRTCSPASRVLRTPAATSPPAPSAEARPISERERWICAARRPELRARGVLFAGLDVIGGWLTEVNITSPTCIREIDRDRGTTSPAT